MRTYNEAVALASAGVTEFAGYAGGRTRRVSFEFRGGGAVAARMFKTDVVTFYPDRFEVRMGGYVTPSTFDGISAALRIRRGGTHCGTEHKVPYVLGVPMDAHAPKTFGYAN